MTVSIYRKQSSCTKSWWKVSGDKWCCENNKAVSSAACTGEILNVKLFYIYHRLYSTSVYSKYYFKDLIFVVIFCQALQEHSDILFQRSSAKFSNLSGNVSFIFLFLFSATSKINLLMLILGTFSFEPKDFFLCCLTYFLLWSRVEFLTYSKQ